MCIRDRACENIASHCKGLSVEKAYVLGLLHDIGRHAGVSSEKPLIDGYLSLIHIFMASFLVCCVFRFRPAGPFMAEDGVVIPLSLIHI